MSQLAEIAAIAGTATADDVLRVARQGGTSARDWAIAHAIEQVTGRPAADTMWGPTHVPGTTTAPEPANPNAAYDPAVKVYAEDTAPAGPDAGPDRITPHHPGDHDPAEDTDTGHDQAAAEQLAATVHADIAALTGTDIAAWITTQVAAQPTRDVARNLLADLMDTPGRLRHHLATAA